MINEKSKTTNMSSRAERAKALLGVVANSYGLTPADLLGQYRYQNFVEARKLACYLLFRGVLGGQPMSLCEIGTLLARHHTTVMSALKTFEGDGPNANHLKHKAYELEQTYRTKFKYASDLGNEAVLNKADSKILSGIGGLEQQLNRLSDLVAIQGELITELKRQVGELRGK